MAKQRLYVDSDDDDSMEVDPPADASPPKEEGACL